MLKLLSASPARCSVRTSGVSVQASVSTNVFNLVIIVDENFSCDMEKCSLSSLIEAQRQQKWRGWRVFLFSGRVGMWAHVELGGRKLGASFFQDP